MITLTPSSDVGSETTNKEVLWLLKITVPGSTRQHYFLCNVQSKIYSPAVQDQPSSCWSRKQNESLGGGTGRAPLVKPTWWREKGQRRVPCPWAADAAAGEAERRV